MVFTNHQQKNIVKRQFPFYLLTINRIVLKRQRGKSPAHEKYNMVRKK